MYTEESYYEYRQSLIDNYEKGIINLGEFTYQMSLLASHYDLSWGKDFSPEGKFFGKAMMKLISKEEN